MHKILYFSIKRSVLEVCLVTVFSPSFSFGFFFNKFLIQKQSQLHFNWLKFVLKIEFYLNINKYNVDIIN